MTGGADLFHFLNADDQKDAIPISHGDMDAESK